LQESNNNAQLAALRLCQQAIDNSTTDNVTVMVVRFHGGVFNAC
jgi:protein phosphatase PTC1